MQVPLHHPADLAHRMLSLMSVCGDRLTLGVSPGSTDDRLRHLRPGLRRSLRDLPPQNLARLRVLLAHGRDEHADLAPAAVAGGGPPLLLGSWGANVERAARDFDGWLASGYRSTPDQIIAAHERYRAAGGRRAIVCAIPLDSRDDLETDRRGTPPLRRAPASTTPSY